MKPRSRLDVVNHTYNGDITPSSWFCADPRMDENPGFAAVEEQLRRRIRDLETDWNASNERGSVSDATTATVNLDEKWVSILNATLEDLAECNPNLRNLLFLMRDCYEDSFWKINMAEKTKTK